ncbi:hypothetical protein CRM22_009541 [Opisthorchis felineus]|uniref:Uncharacterized protein n=1 Tax=Opisthorchis felineus TaxID=147828 RepID=A0A4S2L778_OPIFE|nr:hypothetical protein CRM22_009541 [Opisthorchis felineus]
MRLHTVFVLATLLHFGIMDKIEADNQTKKAIGHWRKIETTKYNMYLEMGMKIWIKTKGILAKLFDKKWTSGEGKTTPEICTNQPQIRTTPNKTGTEETQQTEFQTDNMTDTVETDEFTPNQTVSTDPDATTQPATDIQTTESTDEWSTPTVLLINSSTPALTREITTTVKDESTTHEITGTVGTFQTDSSQSEFVSNATEPTSSAAPTTTEFQTDNMTDTVETDEFTPNQTVSTDPDATTQPATDIQTTESTDEWSTPTVLLINSSTPALTREITTTVKDESTTHEITGTVGTFQTDSSQSEFVSNATEPTSSAAPTTTEFQTDNMTDTVETDEFTPNQTVSTDPDATTQPATDIQTTESTDEWSTPTVLLINSSTPALTREITTTVKDESTTHEITGTVGTFQTDSSQSEFVSNATEPTSSAAPTTTEFQTDNMTDTVETDEFTPNQTVSTDPDATTQPATDIQTTESTDEWSTPTVLLINSSTPALTREITTTVKDESTTHEITGTVGTFQTDSSQSEFVSNATEPTSSAAPTTTEFQTDNMTDTVETDEFTPNQTVSTDPDATTQPATDIQTTESTDEWSTPTVLLINSSTPALTREITTTVKDESTTHEITGTVGTFQTDSSQSEFVSNATEPTSSAAPTTTEFQTDNMTDTVETDEFTPNQTVSTDPDATTQPATDIQTTESTDEWSTPTVLLINSSTPALTREITTTVKDESTTHEITGTVGTFQTDSSQSEFVSNATEPTSSAAPTTTEFQTDNMTDTVETDEFTPNQTVSTDPDATTQPATDIQTTESTDEWSTPTVLLINSSTPALTREITTTVKDESTTHEITGTVGTFQTDSSQSEFVSNATEPTSSAAPTTTEFQTDNMTDTVETDEFTPNQTVSTDPDATTQPATDIQTTESTDEWSTPTVLLINSSTPALTREITTTVKDESTTHEITGTVGTFQTDSSQSEFVSNATEPTSSAAPTTTEFQTDNMTDTVETDEFTPNQTVSTDPDATTQPATDIQTTESTDEWSTPTVLLINSSTPALTREITTTVKDESTTHEITGTVGTFQTDSSQSEFVSNATEPTSSAAPTTTEFQTDNMTDTVETDEFTPNQTVSTDPDATTQPATDIQTTESTDEWSTPTVLLINSSTPSSNPTATYTLGSILTSEISSTLTDSTTNSVSTIDFVFTTPMDVILRNISIPDGLFGQPYLGKPYECAYRCERRRRMKLLLKKFVRISRLLLYYTSKAKYLKKYVNRVLNSLRISIHLYGPIL